MRDGALRAACPYIPGRSERPEEQRHDPDRRRTRFASHLHPALEGPFAPEAGLLHRWRLGRLAGLRGQQSRDRRRAGKIPQLSADDATKAVEAAERAFPAWAKLTAKQRSNILRKWYELIVANREDLALILTSEQGKPLSEALGEVDIGGAYVEFFAEEARRVYGETIPTQRPDARLLAIKQPIGVCGAITPWNFPNSMITRKVSPALAAGCTVVLKPANETPLSALALAALAEKAGVPKGVFNIITGDAPPIGKVLCEHPAVRFVGFTGSTEVGKILYRQASVGVKKLGLELGGNAVHCVR